MNPGETRRLARTVRIDDPGPLDRYLGSAGDCAFLSQGQGLIGLGTLARFDTDSLDAADIWWQEFCASLEHETELPDLPGVGPIAFGTFLFDPDSSADQSTLIVPRVVIGRRANVSWMTTIGIGSLPKAELPHPSAAAPSPGMVSWADGAMPGPVWETMVGEAVEYIHRGVVEKVVLARDMLVRANEPIEPAFLVRRLRAEYPQTWTYLVDGMVGATPELLVERRRGLITSRVLAGTIRRADASAGVAQLGAQLIASDKDRREHAYAAQSVAETLRPYVTAMNVPPAPYVLELPNVLHLATDVTAVADEQISSLALAQAIHPTAAVCGTPREAARQLIAELESMDRGRYAGPVGWIDMTGDGQWAVALRGGQLSRVDPHEIQVFAGCGIVADSVPEDELLESVAKFIPMRDALS